MCNGDEQCISARRIAVSAAFFIEEEFQQTGNFVYRLYKGSLERQPSYVEFTADREKVTQALDNPFRWDAYVVVCAFSARRHRVRFTKHPFEEGQHGAGEG